jgi:hypothetical protein
MALKDAGPPPRRPSRKIWLPRFETRFRSSRRTDRRQSHRSLRKTHWAFQPIQPPTVEPGQHPIDFLIDKQLQAQNFTAAPAADMRTLIRRGLL